MGKKKTVMADDEIVKQTEEAAGHISPKVGCKRGCVGKGYSWDSIDGSVRICECVFKALKKFYLNYDRKHGKSHPLFLDGKMVLRAWAKKHVHEFPRMREILAKQKGMKA